MIAFDQLKLLLPDIDPEAYIGPVFKQGRLDDRITECRRVAESWKGNSEYIEQTVGMEIWAMSLASALMTITRSAIRSELMNVPEFAVALDGGMPDDEFDRMIELDKLVVVSLERIFAAAELLKGRTKHDRH